MHAPRRSNSRVFNGLRNSRRRIIQIRAHRHIAQRLPTKLSAKRVCVNLILGLRPLRIRRKTAAAVHHHQSKARRIFIVR